jgi:hypothetical protein
MSARRRIDAYEVREDAATVARERAHPEHRANGDEQRYARLHYFMSFTKGLAHGDHGMIVDPRHYEDFRQAIDLGEIDRFTDDVPTGPAAGFRREDEREEVRQWEAPTAGLVYSLQGPDAQAVTMPPAPPLTVDGVANPELAYEMAEVYELALLRDVPLFQLEDGGNAPSVQATLDRLNDMAYTKQGFPGRPRKADDNGQVDRQTVFRGASPGVTVGPYLSQFLVVGTTGRARDGDVADGLIQYGSLQIDQRVDVATPERDFMQTWETYLDVQDGAMGEGNTYLREGDRVARRAILTPRDLATYVHFDALYEAYLNACLMLLEMGTPFDPGFDQLSGNRAVGGAERHAAGFALFGGPHVLSLVTEVATRALRAVRFQKFNNHMRLRPEALAAPVALLDTVPTRDEPPIRSLMEPFRDELSKELLDEIRKRNDDGPALLPMAFSEGSPMHPAYGAGHAAVAGACVTMLKAFFDTSAIFGTRDTDRDGGPETETGFFCPSIARPVTPAAYRVVRGADANTSRVVAVENAPTLTLEGELNKLAANISIGRNMAGVHYFSDYYDSVRMGEQIAIAVLEEQALTYQVDPFIVSVPTFDGDVVRIGRR